MAISAEDKALVERLRADPRLLLSLIQQIQSTTQTVDGDLHPFYGFNPLPKQRRALESKKPVVAMACANQVGKSTTGSMWLDMRLMRFNPLDPTEEFPERARYWACTKGDLIDGLVDRVLSWLPPQEIEIVRRAPGRQFIGMKNGCQCKFKSYDQPRSAFQQESLHGLWNDEEMPREIWQEQQTRLIRYGGQTLLTFTPVEGSVWLHELLFDENNREFLELIQMSMRENTFLPIEHIERYIRTFLDDPDGMAIRVDGDYRLMAGANVFERAQIAAYWDATCDPKRRIVFNENGEPKEVDDKVTSAWEIWHDPEPGMHYSIGGDPTLGGIKGDFQAGVVLNAERTRICAIHRSKGDPFEFGKEMTRVGYFYNKGLLVPELIGIGASTVAAIQQEGYPNVFRRQTYTGAPRRQTANLGFLTGAASKPTLVSEFQAAFNAGMIDIQQAKIVDEARRYVWYRKEVPGSFGCGAATGNDDLLTATMLAHHGLRQVFRVRSDFGLTYDESMVTRLERGAAEAKDESDVSEGWD